MKTNIPRKSFVVSLFLGLCSIPAILKGAKTTPEKPKPKYRRTQYMKLTDEPVEPGDIYVPRGQDPNEPAKRNPKKEGLYACMQGARFGLSSNVDINFSSPSHYGIPANKACGRFEREYWRPVAVVDVF